MTISNFARPLRGVVCPLITPLKTIDTLDSPGLEKLIEHVIAGGVSAIFLLGTSGEGPSLSYRLRSELIERGCAAVRGRIPVLVGITDTAYIESVRMAEIAAKAGADAVVVAPPYYLLYTQLDLIHYIEHLSQSVSLPLFLYNFPGLTKIPYSLETVKRASEIPQVIGLKDSSGDLNYLAAVVNAVRLCKDFTVLIGPEEKFLDAMRLGVHGGVCGGSNVNPETLVALYRAASEGQWDCAAIFQEQVAEMSRLLYSVGDPESSYLRGIKCAAAQLGLCSGVLAPPLRPFSETERLKIEKRIALLQAGGLGLRKAHASGISGFATIKEQ
jgi:dihydrodipicolinate synthase/N-acetylneuraminate lyase